MSTLLERLNGSSSNFSTHPDKIQIPQLSRREQINPFWPVLAQQETENLLYTNQPNDIIAF